MSPTDNPRRLVNRYRLDSVLGKGSMGTVWLATDEVLHRQVAIKEIDFPPGTPPAERAQLEHRTLREARAIAALSNPYVITLFDILNLEQGPVIVMELLRARSLAEILRKVGRLPDGQAATIGVAVASGLMAAHAAGITHRDVKPGNVLICDDGRIKLTDFGIARSSADPAMTATGLLLGSPAYIAPEVASGVPAGPVSDAWSLGGLLFATVEGRPPFDQGTAIATLTSVVKDRVPPHPHSGRLGAVISGLLVKTPNLRMRVDRALTIMRGIADDPSGTNLTAAARIPRESTGAQPLPPAAQRSSGSAAQRSSGSAAQRSSGSAAQRSASNPPTAGPRHARTQDPHDLPPTGSTGTAQRAGTSQTYGRPPVGQDPFAGSAPGQGSAQQINPYPGTRGAPYPPAVSPADSSTQPPASQPPATQPPATQPPATQPPATQPPATQPPANQPGTGHQQRQPQNPPFGPTLPPNSYRGPQGPRPFVQLAEPSPSQLPPPPWAQTGSAALAPLPVAATPPNNRKRIAVAVLVAVVAAVLGFFGVRLIAEFATADASAASSSTNTTPALSSATTAPAAMSSAFTSAGSAALISLTVA